MVYIEVEDGIVQQIYYPPGLDVGFVILDFDCGAIDQSRDEENARVLQSIPANYKRWWKVVGGDDDVE